MIKKVYILGAGGAGREAADIFFRMIHHSNLNYELAGFLDDEEALNDKNVNGIKVLGSINERVPKEDELFVCAISNIMIRKKIIESYQIKNAKFLNLVDPSSIISSSAVIGEGNIIYPNTVISSNVSVGDHVIINMHSTLGHDAKIGNNVVISSFCDITGYVEIGNETFLGSHVSIHPKIKIGNECQIGIGSIVINNVKNGKKVFGYPAKKFDV